MWLGVCVCACIPGCDSAPKDVSRRDLLWVSLSLCVCVCVWQVIERVYRCCKWWWECVCVCKWWSVCVCLACDRACVSAAKDWVRVCAWACVCLPCQHKRIGSYKSDLLQIKWEMFPDYSEANPKLPSIVEKRSLAPSHFFLSNLAKTFFFFGKKKTDKKLV